MVSSYGFGSGQLLSSQNYQACVRQEAGYCGIEWYPSSRTSPDSFGLLHAGGVGQGESTIGTCVSSYVNIPGAVSYPNSLPTINNMCGEGWAKDGTAADLGPLRCKYHITEQSLDTDNNSPLLSQHSKLRSVLTCSPTEGPRPRCSPAPPPPSPPGLRWCTGSSPAASAHKRDMPAPRD